ncbi:hypothetical protein J8I29_04900 [Labrys sp. LIt4]|uniref:hypothetical protein n=1 Tax=Labrys sp. LIt4 TaxID=2821355 RepID=UPI001AE0BFA8|nr:hypothetical protein [Labrys sp. LIt4]MBP0578636.1 hypothetical protein [Labrys sp. LIt4]
MEIPQATINCLFTESPRNGAALGLLALMTGISEQCYYAGWMSDLEYDLWQVAPDTSYGHGTITERQAQLLRLLAEEADGWWTYSDGDDPAFLDLASWREKAASRPAR